LQAVVFSTGNCNIQISGNTTLTEFNFKQIIKEDGMMSLATTVVLWGLGLGVILGFFASKPISAPWAQYLMS
jgi:hypothetical protein